MVTFFGQILPIPIKVAYETSWNKMRCVETNIVFLLESSVKQTDVSIYFNFLKFTMLTTNCSFYLLGFTVFKVCNSYPRCCLDKLNAKLVQLDPILYFYQVIVFEYVCFFVLTYVLICFHLVISSWLWMVFLYGDFPLMRIVHV